MTKLRQRCGSRRQAACGELGPAAVTAPWQAETLFLNGYGRRGVSLGSWGGQRVARRRWVVIGTGSTHGWRGRWAAHLRVKVTQPLPIKCGLDDAWRAYDNKASGPADPRHR